MDKYRPIFHITPSKGWINDPNGFIYFKDKYHLYAQHNPYGIEWGPMHWLHFVSEDLVNWKEEGVVLKPDAPYDHEYGCFSGSSIEVDGKLYVLYTGALYGHQVQCLAISEDGHHFEKYSKNPVIAEKDLPRGYLIQDFRDPKVFKKDGIYYVLLVARHKKGYSSILLYKSKDLFKYKFVGVIKSFSNLDEDGMVECPDVIFQGDKCALLYSLQKARNVGDKFQNRYTVAYQVGTINLKKGNFIPLGEEHDLDKGFDCYASHTLSKDNKNYVVYWESMWAINYPTAVEGYVGQLSLIKEINIVDDKLVMKFLPNEKTNKLKVQLTNDVSSLKINNIEITFYKKDNKVVINRKDMEQSIIDGWGELLDTRYFHLNKMEYVDIEYSYDNSCVELSFNNGEIFASLLNIKKGSEANISSSGLKIV